jgi:hypothetical protein
LFERDQEEKEMGISSGNKALSIMMKMGFTPGQALGKQNEHDKDDSDESAHQEAESSNAAQEPDSHAKPKRLAEPIALQEWQGADAFSALLEFIFLYLDRERGYWQAKTRPFTIIG